MSGIPQAKSLREIQTMVSTVKDRIRQALGEGKDFIIVSQDEMSDHLRSEFVHKGYKIASYDGAPDSPFAVSW